MNLAHYSLIIALFLSVAAAAEEVDLLNQEWTAGDFSTALFQAKQDGKGDYTLSAARIVPVSTEIKQVHFWEGATQLAKEKIGYAQSEARGAGSGNLYQVSAAIDNIYQRLLSDQNFNKSFLGSQEDKITKLDTLLRNLLQHDKFIKDYNSNRLTNLATINEHTTLEKLVMMRRKEVLGASEVEDLKRWEIADIRLARLKESIDKGMGIDRAYMLSKKEVFENFTRKMTVEEKSWMLKRYAKIINSAYVSNLMSSIENDTFVWLPFAWYTLSRIGMSDSAIKKLREDGKPVLLNRLKGIAWQMPSDDVETFFKKIRDLVLGVVIDYTYITGHYLKDLQPDALNRKQLTNLLNTMLDLEEKYGEHARRLSLAKGEAVLQEVIRRVPEAKDRESLANRFRIISIKDPFEALVNNILDTILKVDRKKITERAKTEMDPLETQQKFTLAELLVYPRELAYVIKEMTSSIEHSLNLTQIKTEDLLAPSTKWFEIFLDRSWREKLIKKEVDPYLSWARKNREYDVFEYNQSEWGTDEVLGGGVCAAITYQWIKSVLANPDKVIKSVDDLTDNTSYLDLGGSKISAQTRKINAEYQIGLRLFGLSSDVFAPLVLDRDGLQQKIVTKMRSNVAGVVDSVLSQKEEERGRSYGLTMVGMFGETGGHAIAFQIDHQRKHYRFWDPNAGMWQFPNAKVLKEELTNFVGTFYEGQFDKFDGRQIWRK